MFFYFNNNNFNNSYFKQFIAYLIIWLAFFNGFKTENHINSYNLFKSYKCEKSDKYFKNDKHLNNNEELVLNFSSKVTLNCDYEFDYSLECFNTSLWVTNFQHNCDQIELDFRYPKELQSQRVFANITSSFNNKKLVKNILLNISSVGKKLNGEYYVYIQVKKANHSSIEYYLATHFKIRLNDLGNKDDQCSFGDQCYSDICKDSKCLCSKDLPISHDGNCLQRKQLLETCYVTEQCQFEDQHQLVCIDIKGNKTCQCISDYIFLESPQPKCLSPKHYNQSCELSEECQAIDENSFCSSQKRCQCIPKHTIGSINKCSKTEVSNSFPYAIFFSTICGLITIVIISLIFYKYYFVNRFLSKNSNQKAIQLKKSKEDQQIDNRKQTDNRKQNKLIPQQIQLHSLAKKWSEDEISIENDNIYDDIAEIRYVTNQKNAKN